MNEWIMKVILLVISSATPDIKNSIVEWLDDLEVRAKATPNPIDDVLVGLLKTIFNVRNTG